MLEKVVIGTAELWLGDSLELMATLKAGEVSAVITDPPYSTPTVASFGRKVIRRLSDLAIQEFYFGEIKKRLEALLPESAPFLAFCDDAYYPVLFSLFYDWHQTNLLIWDKGKFGMGAPFRRQHELIFYGARGTVPIQPSIAAIPTILKAGLTKKHHGAEKPVELIELLIAGLVPVGGTVFDPFMGSASTGVAALLQGRRFIGCELEREYFDTACKRISNAMEQSKQRLSLTGLESPPEPPSLGMDEAV